MAELYGLNVSRLFAEGNGIPTAVRRLPAVEALYETDWLPACTLDEGEAVSAEWRTLPVARAGDTIWAPPCFEGVLDAIYEASRTTQAEVVAELRRRIGRMGGEHAVAALHALGGYDAVRHAAQRAGDGP